MIELLPYSPVYCVVGLYRLVCDAQLFAPILHDSRATIVQSALFLVPYCLLVYPLLSLYIQFIARSVPTPDWNLPLSPRAFATLSLLLAHVDYILKWRLKSVLRNSRIRVWEHTIASRAKPIEWWSTYVEEWKEPPFESAHKAIQKEIFYRKISSPFMKFLLLRCGSSFTFPKQ